MVRNKVSSLDKKNSNDTKKSLIEEYLQNDNLEIRDIVGKFWDYPRI